jgi:hypothetical protein
MPLIVLIKGEDKRSIPFTTTNKLATLRTKLEDESFMTAQDRFLNQGAEITPDDESKVDVKDILDGNNLTIKPSAKPSKPEPGSKNITFAKGTEKKNIRADPKSKLSDLRKQLEQDKHLLPTDRFEYGGAEIDLKDEAEIIVEEILKDNVLTVKASNKVTPGKTPDAPKVDSLIPKSGYNLNPTANPEGLKVLETIAGERAAAATTGLVYYYHLNDAEKTTLLYKKLQLTRGLLIQPKAFSKSAKDVRTLNGEPIYTMPEFTLDIDREVSFSETVHELRKRGVQTAKGSAGAFGVAVSATYTKETETFSSTKEESVYLIAREDVPKVELQFTPEQITPTNEFLQAVQGVLAMSTAKKEQQYLKLLEVLDQFGFYMATKFTLGGQVWAEDQKTVKTEIQAKSELESFGVAFEANLEASGYPVSASGGYGQLNEEKQTDIKIEGKRRITKKFKGGDPAAHGKIESWIASLGNSERWDVIKYTELKPTLDLLPSDQRNRCANIINTYCLLPDTARITALDMLGYARLLTSGYSDEF